ncbi:type IX secretion system membrane protein PorP/SprF [Mucilaginibacter daejeonensis]|uniref:PorP/SprF family type IX secretion system membrane protein n=1 Tax=Mucilaginibacter daejeonensis TaxID=398049 RepID=UPI001D176DEB|nr:type IX secretion system membrane protein PorP/SprF [Mucilaginibacter daejeonensis]UEG52416.1 type IX secretion system membrane protein PorP/SprF [Mucilaginibacter daejeonensis]
MKRPILTLSLLMACWCLALAQQKPQYTQYMFNNYLLNPAVSGIENYTDMRAGYRSQWTGLEGAPVTSYLSVNMPLGDRFLYGDPMSMQGENQNPLSRLATQDYMAAEPHHGVGIIAMTDRAGPINQTSINGTYAYHLGLTSKLNLSVGVSAGINRITLDVSQVKLENPDDPAIYNGNNSQYRPDVGMGVWAYSGQYYFGVSVQQLIKQTITFGDRSVYNQGKTVPHYFFTGGVKVFLDDDITLLPSALFKLVSPAPASFDINLKLAFSNKFWVGGSYRHNDAKSAMLGLNLSKVINLGYAYDFTSSNLRTVSNGTHEIVLAILFNNRYNVSSAQRSW